MNDSLKRISIDSKVMAGKPVIAGTRIPVDLILEKLAANIDVREILEDYPGLKIDDLKAAIYYAKTVVANEEFFPVAK